MHRAAWIIGLLLIVPTARAGDWEKFSTDLELFEQLIVDDQLQMQIQQEDAELEDSADLFPGEEEEEAAVTGEEEKFTTISVDGTDVLLSDVPTEEWFSEYVVKAAQLNLISGYRDSEGKPTGEFGPEDYVTVEQLAKMAIIAAGIDTYNCGDTLINTTAKGRWSQKYIQCAEHLGFAVFSDGSIKVTKPAHRSEVAITVLQAFSVRIAPVSGSIFEDVTRATPYGNAVETMSRDGVVSGYTQSNGNPTGYFGPSDPVNRAETAKIFSLSSQTYGTR
ncbi:MAG: S-layer homology domain-containing protein [bacterium]|nr:S-layer homology domain-containing protein [bacterium]MDA1292204.1 S-layer homology domain-containing protein [bacterium]